MERLQNENGLNESSGAKSPKGSFGPDIPSDIGGPFVQGQDPRSSAKNVGADIHDPKDWKPHHQGIKETSIRLKTFGLTLHSLKGEGNSSS